MGQCERNGLSDALQPCRRALLKVAVFVDESTPFFVVDSLHVISMPALQVCAATHALNVVEYLGISNRVEFDRSPDPETAQFTFRIAIYTSQ